MFFETSIETIQETMTASTAAQIDLNETSFRKPLYIDAFTHVKMVRDYMDWHFRKNEPIYPGTERTLYWKEDYTPETSDSHKTVKFYYCDLEEPPKKKTRGEFDRSHGLQCANSSV